MLGAALGAVVLMAATAQAAPVIDFQTGLAGEGGTISWDGTNLIGSNIPIGAVNITGAPTGNGVFTVSGTAAGTGRGGPFGSLAFNTNPDNNFITLTGCIPGLSVGLNANGNCDPIDLLTGSFTGFTGGSNGLLVASGADFKAEELMDAINWSTTLPWEFFGFSMTTRGLDPDGTPGVVISTDIRNTAVPEPATMMLLGTGLLAAFRARRRQA
ncbi:MAG: PEP-CTERM sorting domain-containing protein [Cyanobacteria bacterium]|nr:PEP-CTERM sorting domain-containing protein [Cyanobacteriota bacterium]